MNIKEKTEILSDHIIIKNNTGVNNLSMMFIVYMKQHSRIFKSKSIFNFFASVNIYSSLWIIFQTQESRQCVLKGTQLMF